MDLEGSDKVAQIFRDYYKEYAISLDASEIEIKRKLRPLLQKYHPDAQEGKSEQEKEIAQKEFSRIHDAYQTLTNVATRRVYDLEYKRRIQVEYPYFNQYEDQSSKETKDSSYVERMKNDSSHPFYAYFEEQKDNSKKENNKEDVSKKKTSSTIHEDLKKLIEDLNTEVFNALAEPTKEDFSVIIAIEDQMKDLEEKIRTYEKQMREYNVMYESLSKQFVHFKNEVQKEKSYRDAILILKEIEQKEQSPLKKLFINQMDFEKKKLCLELMTLYDEKIENYQRELKVEMEKKAEKLNQGKKEYYENQERKEQLKTVYLNHPLRLKYEKFKQKEEERKLKVA